MQINSQGWSLILVLEQLFAIAYLMKERKTKKNISRT